MNIRLISIVTLTAVLAACSSTPDRNNALEQARSKFETAQSNPQVTTHAADELQQAESSLRKAENAWKNREKDGAIEHLSYLATQRVAIAEETASNRASQEIISEAAAERDKVRLALRTSEADTAKQRLALSEQSNAARAAALTEAEAAAERNKARLALSEQSNAERAAALAEAEAAAERQRERASELEQAAMREQERVNELEKQLKELNAKQTDRGLVVTLGDVLFDTGKSELMAQGTRNVNKLAEVLGKNPDSKILIEGHTDNVGNESYNYALAQRRADAVKSALASQGIPSDRLTTRSQGPDMPAADNSTAAGRQMNRRVEIIFESANNNGAN